MRKILSYIIPMRLKTYVSEINGELEVNILDGKKTLDTPNSNYSYGSVQKVFYRGLIEISFSEKIEKVLVLGLGGGCVVQTIRKKFKSKAFMELVELDPQVISIAINDFNINRYKNINIVNADALDYIKNCKDSFDLIIVDIFIVDVVPEIFTKSKFIKSLSDCLNHRGYILFNTMRETMKKESFDEIKNGFLSSGLEVKVLREVENTNDLIIAKKHN